MTHKGEIYRFEDVYVLPRPTQYPHPPMWVAAIQTPESFEWVGENGYNLLIVPYLADYELLRKNIQLYKKAQEEAGHGPVKKDQMAMMLHCYVREDEQQAINEARPHCHELRKGGKNITPIL